MSHRVTEADSPDHGTLRARECYSLGGPPSTMTRLIGVIADLHHHISVALDDGF